MTRPDEVFGKGKADGDMDSPFDADCCPVHPGNVFVLT